MKFRVKLIIESEDEKFTETIFSNKFDDKEIKYVKNIFKSLLQWVKYNFKKEGQNQENVLHFPCN